MDEEMVEFVREAYEDEEIDMDYEFDAPKFYDFTQPESDWEAEEAEDWFRFAGSYQPSPFIAKLLNWYKGIPVEPAKTSPEPKDVECITSISNYANDCMEAEEPSTADDDNRGLNFSNDTGQDTPNTKPNSPVKSLSRSSTLMKPTASQLAKQNQRREVHSNRVLRRYGKKLGKFDENSQNSSPSIDCVATKRQKLEAGYVRKNAQLKHQPLWLHKVPKKVGAEAISANSRPKVTIPREPNLETAHRAQRRRFKLNAKPGEQEKTLKAPPFPTPKKSAVQATEFQVFHLRTSARAKQQTFYNVTNAPNSSYFSQDETTDIKGPSSVYACKQEKSEMLYKCTACSLKKKTLPSKDLKFSIDKRLLKEPPTDLFNKLSLGPEAQHNAKPQSKSAFAC